MAESKNRDLIAEANELWPALDALDKPRDHTRLQLVDLPDDVELSFWFERLRIDRFPSLRGQSPSLLIPMSPAQKVALGLAEWSHDRPGELVTRQANASGVVAVAAVTLLAAATFDEVTGWFFDPEQRRPLAKKRGEDWRDEAWEKFLRLAVILRNARRLAGVFIRTKHLAELRGAGIGFGAYPSTHEAVLQGLLDVASWVQHALDRHRLLGCEEDWTEALQRLGVRGAPPATVEKNQLKAKLAFRDALGDVWRNWAAPWSPRAQFESELRGIGHWARGFERRLEAERSRVVVVDSSPAPEQERDVGKLVLALYDFGVPAKAERIKPQLGWLGETSVYNRALKKARDYGLVQNAPPSKRWWKLTPKGVRFAEELKAARKANLVR